MNFTGNLFLFFLFPVFLTGYLLIPGIKSKNYFLLLASILFYFLGEPCFVLVLLLSVVFNYFVGRFLYVEKNDRKRNVILFLALLFNVGILFLFKYTNFIITSINAFFNTSIPLTQIPLPIGISFFTFQIISYVLDLYFNKNREELLEKNVLNLGLYIMMFPQLVAGPIVRYSEIQKNLTNRRFSLANLHDGIRLFIIGLSKKVIIANSMAIVADRAFSLPEGDAGWAFLVLGAVSYTFQIFFDFSGYSDMAIGIGKILGYKFPQNFNYPYISKSVTEFWRRWHMTLSRWFRDYLYIPLGGSRKGIARTIINLFIVWTLTGLWHGANWTFVMWGFLYFVFLSIEKLIQHKTGKTIETFLPFGLSRIYTLSVVILLWVFFRADNISSAIIYIKGMFDFTNTGIMPAQALFYTKEFFFIYVFAFLLSTRIFINISERLKKIVPDFILTLVYDIFSIFLLLICIIFLVKGGYNPFIYFNF